MRDTLTTYGVEREKLPRERAFYGPKIEYHIKDVIGRSWQYGTLQLGFVLSDRLDAECVTESGGRVRPVVLYRTILGSLEHFIGILIENHAGPFPLWLASVQMAVMNVIERQMDYRRQIMGGLQAESFRVELGLRNEKTGYEIHDNGQYRFSYQVVAGDKEKQESKVVVCRRAEDLGSLSVGDFISQLKREAAEPLVTN